MILRAFFLPLLTSVAMAAQVELFNAVNKESLYDFVKYHNLSAKLAEKIELQTRAIFPVYILVFEKTTEKLDGYILTPKNQNLRLTVSKKHGLQKLSLTPTNEKYFDAYDIQEHKLDFNGEVATNSEYKKYISAIVNNFEAKSTNKAKTVSMLSKTTAFYNLTLPASICAIMVSGGKDYMLAFVYNGKLYDKNGVLLSSENPILPVKFKRVSGLFSENRFHPILQYSRAHKGVDLAAKEGSLVFSSLDGYINDIGYNNELGNYVKIQHKSGYETIYGHLSKIKSSLALKTRVSQGDVVGLVGHTGLATGAHLHFGVKKDGDYINPVIFFKNQQNALRDEEFFMLASKAKERLASSLRSDR